MKRYETDVRDGVLYLEAPAGEDRDADSGDDETDDRWLEIGSMDAIVELIGGETYELQYDDRQRAVGWLDADEDGVLSFDVRETIGTTTFDDEFVENVAGAPVEKTNEEGYAQRAAVFADLLTTIWDSKGNLEDAD